MTTNVNDILSRNVRALRVTRGLSQDQLAKLSGVNRSTISMIENNTANPTLNGVLQLAQALGISLEELVSSPLEEETQYFQGSQLKTQTNSDGTVFKVDLLPKTIPGLQFEKLMLRPYAGMLGVPHLKGTWEYCTCIQGELTLTIEGDTYHLKNGEVLSFPGHKKHVYRNPTGSSASGISVVILETREKTSSKDETSLKS